MITIFNRRRLWLDASAEAAARVWSALEAAGIPYEVKTLRSHSTFGRNFHAGMGYEGFQGGVRHSDMADRMSYTYVVYVHRRDYARARALLG